MMIKKEFTYYNCYSPKLLAFLISKGFLPYKQLKHKKTGNMIWRFSLSKNFEQALKEYSEMKKVVHS